MYILATILSAALGLLFIWAYHKLFKGEDQHLFARQASHQLPTPRFGGGAVLLAIFITIFRLVLNRFFNQKFRNKSQ